MWRWLKEYYMNVTSKVTVWHSSASRKVFIFLSQSFPRNSTKLLYVWTVDVVVDVKNSKRQKTRNIQMGTKSYWLLSLTTWQRLSFSLIWDTEIKKVQLYVYSYMILRSELDNKFLYWQIFQRLFFGICLRLVLDSLLKNDSML